MENYNYAHLNENNGKVTTKRYCYHYCCLWISISILLSLLCSILLLSYGIYEKQKTQNLYTETPTNVQRLVCYYDAPKSNTTDDLRLIDVPGNLCTHINIGIAEIYNNKLTLSPQLENLLQNELAVFHKKNPNVKLLLWIGGGDNGKSFSSMVVNHAKRKIFIHSLKQILHAYESLSGIDLDWEFPSAYNKERQHFSQLLHEIRQEWRREQHEQYLLSVAIAAAEGIAIFAYDIRELNLYADYVNLMSYDYHLYSSSTPFTGLNAPLYARENERSILGTININYSVNWWLQNGLEPHRLVVGLPTYGHSFTLVNPFNKRIGAPASGFGQCGVLGFTTYTETCRCASHHLHTTHVYDNRTCSPYLSSGTEWISYEDQKSIACKAEYIKSLHVGGIMAFSLNTDDLKNYCGTYANINSSNSTIAKPVFPLIETIKRILYN